MSLSRCAQRSLTPIGTNPLRPPFSTRTPLSLRRLVMGYKYVASPYSSIDPVTREHRFLTLCEFIADRCHVESLYSPILHWHRIAQILEMPKEEEWAIYASMRRSPLVGAELCPRSAAWGFDACEKAVDPKNGSALR